MKFQRLFPLLAILLLWTAICQAQTGKPYREEYMEWEEFLEAYLYSDVAEAAEQEGEGERGEQARLEYLDRLEDLHRQPLNLNTASRSELLALPFLTVAQVDTLLRYRQRHRRFVTLGELQTIPQITYQQRRYLSLFTFAGDTVRPPQTWQDRWLGGKYEVTARADVPLYRRDGFKSTTASKPNQHYYGPPVAHALRYRYRHRSGAAYGMTLQQDAGEPFGRGNNRPYDYWSVYAQVPLLRQRTILWLGDYDVLWGEGLLMGGMNYGGRASLLGSALRQPHFIRPHTSLTEQGFQRGVAAQTQIGKRWEAQAFASFRRVDAHLDGDTVTSLRDAGLHRTKSEILTQRTLSEVLTGARLLCHWRGGAASVGGYGALYDKTIYPALHDYNRYYLRGKSAGGWSIDAAHDARRWQYRGECAFDASLHAATSHTLRLSPTMRPFSVVVQARYFSPRFVAPYAETLQSASRVQNELGLLLGADYQGWRRAKFSGYVDYSYHERPMYRVSAPSHRLRGWLSAAFPLRSAWKMETRYQYSGKQEDVTGHPGLLQFLHRHSLRLAAHLLQPNYSLHLSADACALFSQTASVRWGRMLSVRGMWKPLPTLQLHTFVAGFWTDDYATRIYGYEPQLRHGGAFPSFAYQGARLVLLGNWQLTSRATISLRYSFLRYFNRQEISSGAARIASPMQNDLSLQFEWRWPGRAHR